jgi:hypothetical protein
MKTALFSLFSMAAFWSVALSTPFTPTPIGPNGEWEHTENGVTYRYFPASSGFVVVDVDPTTAGTVRIRDRVFIGSTSGGSTIYAFETITFNALQPGEELNSVNIVPLNGFGTPSDLLENCDQITRLEIGQSFAGAAYAALFEDCTALEEFYVYKHPNDVSTVNAVPADANFSSDGVLYGNRRPASEPLETQLIHYPAAKSDTTFTVPSYVDAIGVEAFHYEGPSPSLTSITFPVGLQTIRERAFLGHSSLRSVQFAASMQRLTIKEEALSGLL